MNNISQLPIGTKFMRNEKKYVIKSRGEQFTYCFSIPYDGYNYYMYNDIVVDEIEDETFKSNPDHKRNMHP